MTEYLIRLVQHHETFRKPELEAIAALANVDLEFVEYSDESPFCVVRLQSDADAAKLAARCLLFNAIYELWGIGTDYPSLHASVKERTPALWPQYKTGSFSFQMDSFQGKRSNAEKRELIDSFSYVGFVGPIKMKSPDQAFVILEEWDPFCVPKLTEPKRVALGRLIAESPRTQKVLDKYDLKKRGYISTTSMDSELALITANLALAAPGKLMYDPFTGTGSFPIACAHFGATVLGSDIDGRSIRGKPSRNVVSNFKQYTLSHRYLDGFVSDLTNSPLRRARYLDGIVCDPPYGVREGLKVLGSPRGDAPKHEIILPDGTPAHLQAGYIPPKRPYSFEAMLDDILDFAATQLVDNARLAMWMPTANDDAVELAIPAHPALRLVSVSVQQFNKWARRLLVFRRVPDAEVDVVALAQRHTSREDLARVAERSTASELNAFRRKYFAGFKDSSTPTSDSDA